MALDHVTGFHIVIAASGMCEAGRIRHRLKTWIWREEGTVLFTGFQAAGTLGRILLGGAGSVRIQGEEFAVRARIRSLDLYSGHADGTEICAWIKARLPIRNQIFLVHGEEAAMAGLAARLHGVLAPRDILMPALDEGFSLAPTGAQAMARVVPPRLQPAQVARPDWHNDVSRLILDINDALQASPDERSRGVLIRRLQRALDGTADV
jgi:metallo-beta-lactamase family protein